MLSYGDFYDSVIPMILSMHRILYIRSINSKEETFFCIEYAELKRRLIFFFRFSLDIIQLFLKWKLINCKSQMCDLSNEV